jgi:threonyl-tRNA synthetase
VDFNLPERFGAFYVDKDGEKVPPVMLHRAILRLDGAVPRHPDREATPAISRCGSRRRRLWWRPSHQDADAYAQGGRTRRFWLKSKGLNVETRQSATRRSTTRCASTRWQKVPVIVVCGMREAEERTVNVRRLGSRDQSSMTLDEVTAALVDEATPPDVKRRAAED